MAPAQPKPRTAAAAKYRLWLLVPLAAVAIWLFAGGWPIRISVPDLLTGYTDRSTMIFLGDLMLGRRINEIIVEREPGFLWGDTIPLLRGADAVVANLETVIAEGGERVAPAKDFYFRASPRAIGALLTANISFVSTGNNHVLDYGANGLAEMLGHLDHAGIHHAGAGANLGEAMKPSIFEAGTVTVGVISWTDRSSRWAATENTPGAYRLPVTDESADALIEQIEELKRDVDLVIVSAHWGPNWREHPKESHQRFARRLIDGGLDVLHGHSAHNFQGVEVYRNGLILYDTGGFIDDFGRKRGYHNDVSFIFRVVLQGARPVRLELVPVVLQKKPVYRVNLAMPQRAGEIMDLMEARSESFNQSWNRVGSTLITEVP